MSGPFRPRGDQPDEPEREPEPEVEPEPAVQPEPEPEPEPEREMLKRPPPPPKQKGVSGVGASTTWIVGVMATLLVVYITYNTISTDHPGSRGVPVGTHIPPFTVPLALANLKCKAENGDLKDCDANVQTVARKGIPKACDAHREGALNSCDLAAKGPLVLAFMAAPSDRCIEQVDQLNKLAPRFPDVQFLAVAIRGNHAELNDLIKERGWTIPVAYDHDGAVANAFAVAVCPTVTFAYKDGLVRNTTLGSATEAEVTRDLRAIQAGPPPSPTPSPTPTASPET